MHRQHNPEMDRLILDHLATLYNIKQRREGIHLSTLVYCITRSFFDQQSPVEPTDEEVMFFALGYGLQDVLTPNQAKTPAFELDGVIFRPDFMLPFNNKYVELKTTRASMKKNLETLPETWVEYIMGGCFIRGITSYELSVLYMMGSYAPPFPMLYSETLEFEQGELEANWDYLMKRKGIYIEALNLNQPPTPFQFCKDWECKSCRYKLQCEALTMLAERGLLQDTPPTSYHIPTLMRT